MAVRLSVQFVSNAALAQAFGTTESDLAVVNEALSAYEREMDSTDSGYYAYLAYREAAKLVGPATWFLGDGDGLGRLETVAANVAIAASICDKNAQAGTSTDPNLMRRIIASQIAYADGYDRNGYDDAATEYRSVVDTLLTAIDAGLVAHVSFG